MADFFHFSNVFENIQTNHRSMWLHEVLPEKVEVRINPRGWHNEIHNSDTQTPFYYTRLCSPWETWTDPMKRLIEKKIESQRMSIAEFSERSFQIVCDVIEDEWIPEKNHIMFHSSGVDSNFISLAIKHLHKKNGDNWLGKMIFVELDGETSMTQVILNMEGWLTSNNHAEFYSHFIGAPNKLRDVSVEFNNMWYRVNCTAIPICFWREVETMLPADILNNAQFISGYGTNNIRFPAQQGLNIAQSFNKFYYSGYSTLPLNDDSIIPFVSLDFIEHVFTNGLYLGDYRAPMLYEIAPEYEDVRRMEWEYKFNNHRDISPEKLEAIYSTYKASWWGAEVEPNVEPTSRLFFSEWWGNYTLASLCEKLRNEGREVVIERKGE